MSSTEAPAHRPPVPQFHIYDRILVPQHFWTVHGRRLYRAARVLEIDVDVFEQDGEDEHLLVQDDAESDSSSRYFIYLTFEYDDNPGEEGTMYSDEKAYGEILPWNLENLLRVEHDDMGGLMAEIVQRAGEDVSPETLIRWLKMVVENRRPVVFNLLTQYDPHFADLPYAVLGPRFLRLALLPSQVPIVKQFCCDEDSRKWSEDMDQLVTSICDLCGMDFSTFSVEAAAAVSGLGTMDGIIQEATSTTWEHVAAQRDDSKLLVWLLDYKWNMFREFWKNSDDEDSLDLFDIYHFRHRDSRDRNPLHVAALYGSVSIVETYREAEAQKRAHISYFQSLFDFYAEDADGRTALGIASEAENEHDRQVMKTALLKLLQQIYQRVLDRALAPDFFDRETTKEIDYDFLANIVSKFNLDLSGYGENWTKKALYAAEKGELRKLIWLVDEMKLVDLHENDRGDNGHRLVEAAARRPRGRGTTFDHRANENKMLFLEDWDGLTPLPESLEEFCHGNRPFNHSWPEPILDRLPNLGIKRASLAWWLIARGMAVPDADFIVNQCELIPAEAVLKYRLDLYGLVENWFCDEAPQAMILVNEFLLGEREANNASPQSIALLCVQESACDLQNHGELTRLGLLNSIFQNYDVDPSTLRDSEGRTILHLAILRDQCLIAAWLCVTYRSLVYTRSCSGKLPVHIALEEGASEHVCITMLRFTGDTLFKGMGLEEDRRVFSFADCHGKTVRDYALVCKHSTIRKLADESLLMKFQSEMSVMIANESTTIVDFLHFVEKRGLVKYKYKFARFRFPLLHAAIGFGRLDVLSWLDRSFFGRKQMLPNTLSNKGNRSEPFLPIVCHPGVDPRVGDLLEVQCFFRKNPDHVVLMDGQQVSPAVLDGKWKIENWMPIDDSPATMLIYDLRGTSDVVGIEECDFVILQDGTLEVTFETGRPVEIWYSSCAVVGTDIVRIELTRKSTHKTYGLVLQNNDRKLVMTKISAHDADSIPYEWRLGIVQQATDTELLIEYSPEFNLISLCFLTKSHTELIERDSTRINKSGILKRAYSSYMERNRKSGKDFADRCGQPGIVNWIAKAEHIAHVRDQLEDLESDFFVAFLSDTGVAELEARIHSARQILEDADLPSVDTEELEASLYILDRCWQEQPKPSCHFCLTQMEEFHELEDTRPVVLAATMGKPDLLRWIVETRRVGSDSPHLRHALKNAAEYDQLDTIKILLLLGADPDGDFSQFLQRHASAEDVPETRLITIAIKSLSLDVFLLLMENETDLPDTLVTQCVQSHRVYGANMAAKVKEKSFRRSEILKFLLHRGARPSGETMKQFVRNLQFVYVGSYCDVPVTLADLHLLCQYGGDIVSAFQSDLGFFEAPVWFTDYIADIQSDEKVLSSLLNNQAKNYPTYDAIRIDTSRDIAALRDRRGRGLLELAAMAENRVLVQWLVQLHRKGGCGSIDLALVRELCRKARLADMFAFLDGWEQQQLERDTLLDENVHS